MMSLADESAGEGETPLDVSGLRDKTIRTRAQLNLAELANVAKVTQKYLLSRPSKRKARFDASWLFRLHGEMFGDVWQWAGQPRTENLNVGAPFHAINEQIQQLVDDLRYWEANWPDLVEQAVYLHVAAVRIHFRMAMDVGRACWPTSG